MNKIKTYIQGFDIISKGGLPEGRTTLVCGSAGSAKTVFAIQFLIHGIIHSNEAAVFITFEESTEDICENMEGFGWNLSSFIKEGKLMIVDASPRPEEDAIVAGAFDLAGLLARIEFAVKKINAKRVSMDSMGAVFTKFSDIKMIRGELFRTAAMLKQLNVTSVLTAERQDEYGDISRFGVEEFVADNVIILRNALDSEKRRRTVEILKFRGTSHQKGEYPFTMLPDKGIIVIPLSGIELKQESTTIRITSGNADLDALCHGGFYRDSIVLISGATGTGKTLIATEFMAGGAINNERSLLFAFEESKTQFFRNAAGWGIDFEEMEKKGLLKVIALYPEIAALEDHLVMMKEAILEFKPKRIAIDSLSALERISNLKGFREFVISLTAFIKDNETAGLFTAATPTLVGGSSISEQHISTITDSIIILRYVEVYGEMRRGLTVLKMRGSDHDREIREVKVSKTGMSIGEPFRNITGILSGNIQHLEMKETERLDTLFQE